MFDLSQEVTVKVITIWRLKKVIVHKPVIYKIILPMEQSFRHKNNKCTYFINHQKQELITHIKQISINRTYWCTLFTFISLMIFINTSEQSQHSVYNYDNPFFIIQPYKHMVVIKSAVFPRMAEGTKYNNIALIDKKCYSTLFCIYI